MTSPRLLPAVLIVFLLVLAALPAAAEDKGAGEAKKPEFGPYFSGQLLVARPKLADTRFAETVIYLAEHAEDGAFGLVLNRVQAIGPWRSVLKQLNLDVPTGTPEALDDEVRLHYGGPVRPGAGFVLHTSEYRRPGTEMIRGRFAVTFDPGILVDIVSGKGPRRHRLVLGYSGWRAGQLDGELERGHWDVIPADEELIFSEELKSVWQRARERIGVRL